jgi:LemA protein
MGAFVVLLVIIVAVPNLVETVKGYAKHEREVFEKVTQARAAAVNAQTVKDQGQAENVLTGALKSLFAVAENYPELKANQNFLMLQEELAGTEGKVAYARQFYNDTVMKFNMRQQVFPSNLIANMFGFKPRDYFQIEEEVAKGPVMVQF